jgi:voltage-gated potassium channel Kch
MLQPDKPITTSPAGRFRAHGFSAPQVGVLFAAFTLLMSIPIWTHPLPPLSDYVNHLARMHVIATLSKNPQLARFYEIDWQIIPNLTMDLIVPLLARFMNVYLAGQIFIVGMFALLISGVLALNRALTGRWTVFPLFALPLIYNYVFLVGLMNYIFGIGIALWALAGWVALRDRMWPARFLLSTVCVVALFFCHLSSLGIYGIGVLAFEISRLWQRRAEPWPWRIVDFVAGGLPFLAAAPFLNASPTMQLVGATYWDQRGKWDGLMYVFSNYSDMAAFAIIFIMVGSGVWAVRRRVLRFHPLALPLIIVGGAIYFALPRIMFDTYMTDQRVPLGIVFMVFACGDLELRRRLVRRAFMVVLIMLITARLIEIDLAWSQLSDSTSEFRSSVRRIVPGSKVFVAYSDRSQGDDVRDLGLVHAACIATIERSALVTTLFTVQGKQVLHTRPEFRDFADLRDGTPPAVAQLMQAADRPQPWMPAFWKNWTQFDYVYILFTEDEAANPDPARLKLVDDGDRFQLYRVIKPQDEAAK